MQNYASGGQVEAPGNLVANAIWVPLCNAYCVRIRVVCDMVHHELQALGLLGLQFQLSGLLSKEFFR